MVGPFIFFRPDGPVEFLLGTGMDVRPHPHIGLFDRDLLFDGEIMHRDSLGTELPIRPGELNWMTAGRGITHSERTASSLRQTGSKLFGIQSWVALSAADEETAPAFEHYDAASLPVLTGEGKTVRLIAGEAFGARSPVRTSSLWSMPTWRWRRAPSSPSIRPTTSGRSTRSRAPSRSPATVSGSVNAGVPPGDRISVRATEAARFMVLGGEADGRAAPSLWNFVSSRPDRIAQAKEDWRQGRFDTVPNDAEFIPLPEDPPRSATVS